MRRADCGPDALLHGAVAERVLAPLHRDAGDGAPQHQLILGPRGSGKTVLLRVVGHRIEDEAALAARWFPLTFPEAQYDVARLADLWTNALDYLAVALLRRGQAAEAREVHDAVRALPQDDEEARAEEAFRLLMAEADALGRRFVLLIDNLDVVLDRLQSHQWRVRDILSAERRLLVIGASARAIEATYRYEAAFYDFFRIQELRPLAAAAVPRALAVLAAPEARAAIEATVAAEPHVVRAVTSVVGTLPRALELVADALTAGHTQASAAAAWVLDRLTPELQARIDGLAPQSQLVAHALATAWHPLRAADLAARVRLPTNAVSAQLTRLTREGVVEQVAYPPGTRLGYQLADRMFAVWFLLRAGQPHRRRLLVAVDQLAAAFADVPPPPEHPLTVAAGLVRLGRWPEARAQAAEALAHAVVQAPEELAGAIAFLGAALAFDRTNDARELLAELAFGGAWDLVGWALELASLGGEDPLAKAAPELREGIRAIAGRILRAPAKAGHRDPL